jgi:hypothetical protein
MRFHELANFFHTLFFEDEIEKSESLEKGGRNLTIDPTLREARVDFLKSLDQNLRKILQGLMMIVGSLNLGLKLFLLFFGFPNCCIWISKFYYLPKLLLG